MKGFIEVATYGNRYLISISAIVGVTEQADNACAISLSAPMLGFTTDSTLMRLENSYDEITALIKEAQES